MTVLQAQTITAENLKIAQDTYGSLLFQIKNQGIENEMVKIQTDKFGRITNVESKQKGFKNLLLKILPIPFLTDQNELIATSSTLIIGSDRIDGLKLLISITIIFQVNYIQP